MFGWKKSLKGEKIIREFLWGLKKVWWVKNPGIFMGVEKKVCGEKNPIIFMGVGNDILKNLSPTTFFFKSSRDAHHSEMNVEFV